MPISGPLGIARRIIQVFNDYLATELQTIDSEQADGITTPPVLAPNYFEWGNPVMEAFPRITMEVLAASPVQEVRTKGFGNRLHAIYQVDIAADVSMSSAGDDSVDLQRLAYRYAMGIVRTICIKYDQLGTIADPAPYVAGVALRSLGFGPQPAQAAGQQVRTAIVGVNIDRIEYL